MKIRFNITRGDRLAEVEIEPRDGETAAEVAQTVQQRAAYWFPILESAVDADTLPVPPPPAPREAGDDDPARSGPAPARTPPAPISGRDAVPRNGRQLWAWAKNYGCLDRLQALARTQPGRVVSWPEDLVQWALRELGVKTGAGKWGSN